MLPLRFWWRICGGGEEDIKLSSDPVEDEIDPSRNRSDDPEGDVEAVVGRDVVIWLRCF
jgi:hypothetical protein